MRFEPGQGRCCAQVVMWVALAGAAMGQQPASSAMQDAPAQVMTQQGVPEDTAPPPDAKSYVLHVYQNLMQIPTLVVLPRAHMFGTGRTITFDAVTGLTVKNFQISLDKGAEFQPTHMRVEGEDPIALAIVVDLPSHPSFLLPTLGMDLQRMVSSLRPHDHVSLYTASCKLLRWRKDLPANSPELTKEIFQDIAGETPDKHKDDGCNGSDPLYDNLATVVHDLSTLPGHRVIVVVTRGDSTGGLVKWPMLRRYATSHSTAIFGVMPLPELGSQNYQVTFGGEGSFDALCQLTGGLVQATSNSQLRETLANTMDVVRKRYILEFPRPDDGTPGEHDIHVTIPKSMAMIRPAGATVPLPDPAILNDPNTVKSSPSPATYGQRKPLPKPE